MWPNDGVPEWSHHEAGHAVAHVRLGMPFTAVVVTADQKCVAKDDPHPDFLDTNFSAPANLAEARALSWRPEAREYVWRTMIAMAAGPIAQMQFERRPLPADERDFYRFGGTNDAGWIRGYALGLAAYETSNDDEVRRVKRRLINEAVQEACSLVLTNSEAIARLAREIMSVGRVEYNVVLRLLG